MRILSQADVAHLETRLLDGKESAYRLARIFGVSPRWIRTLRSRLLRGEPLPGKVRLGRPPRPIDPVEADFVLAVELHHHQNPLRLERVLDREYGIHVPHNRIWRILKSIGRVRDTPSKQDQRSYLRYQRHHTNSLWQMDFSQLSAHEWLLLIIDDASRTLVGFWRGTTATAEVVWETFQAAGERFGYPKQVLTDHGTQFVKLGHGTIGFFDQQLRILRRKGTAVQHIRARIKHPQTSGKVERVIGTVKANLRKKNLDGGPEFPGGLPEIVWWYNTDCPHESLRRKEGETPAQAFVRKWHPRRSGKPSFRRLVEAMEEVRR